MSENSVVRIDSKGRILIPNTFRELLGLKEGSFSLIEIDGNKKRLILTPLVKKAEKLVRIKVYFSDQPGALAETASLLAQNGVDLVYSESSSIDRGEAAMWDIIADVSRCKTDTEQLKESLQASQSVRKAEIAEI